MHDALLSTNANVAIARAGERLHPVFCLCRRSLQEELEAYLASGSRKVAGWCAEMGAIEVDFSDQCEAFGNFNTLDDLANS
jgi:molybdopterin-guanine dinucleotide biosynthesis protein A